MDTFEYDDYYYRLGRHQAVIELVEGVPKSKPSGISAQYIRDWQQGYNEMSEMFYWRRRPVGGKQAV
ncbi:MAG: hypothetical protein OQK51_24500 [Kangiellaceae bacterium]|nr:hypothetical protein [Kangiellaceae bacterium]